MKKLRYFTFLSLLWVTLSVSAQCGFRNTAFKSGEFLVYNMYYNWKFVWVKAGTASMYTVASRYDGQEAYRSSLTCRGNHRVDDLYVLRDTLLCYNTLDLAPLYYRKGAHEGKRYTVDQVFYSYPDGKCHVRQHRLHHDGKSEWSSHTYNDCVYDMLSIYMRARSFNPKGWKKGHVIRFPIVDGNSRDTAELKFDRIANIKADDGHEYRCLCLAYLEWDKNKGRMERIVDFYVTDDQNHLPVVLDMYLRFGHAKAYLVSMKGIRTPMSAQIR